ncbi:MAG: MFS transporter, partial [Candidatus Dormiibacterota bacterium]
WALVGANTLIQRRTPLRLQGRVDAAFGVLFGAFQTVSIGIGAVFVGAFGYVPPVVAVVVVGALAALYLYTRTAPPANPAVASDRVPLAASNG